MRQYVQDSVQVETRIMGLGNMVPAWLNFSLFAFTAPGLERRYSEYDSRRQNFWGPVVACNFLVGWSLFIGRHFYSNGAYELPALTLGVAVFEVIAFATLLLLMLLTPEFYVKHRKAIHMGAMCNFSVSYWVGVPVLLWMKAVTTRADAQSLVQGLQNFGVENLFFVYHWIMLLGFPIAQIPDLFFVTVFMAAGIALHRSICSSSSWGHSLVTTGPGFRDAANIVSSLLSSIGGPLADGEGGSAAIMSCPAALGLWQDVGWWVCSVAVFVFEILRRRAFL
jgi:hypothetical protein